MVKLCTKNKPKISIKMDENKLMSTSNFYQFKIEKKF